MGGPSVKYGGVISQVWGGPSAKYGGDHQPTMGGPSAKYGGGHQPTMGGPSAKYGGGGIFPPVCTGSQNPENYFSNTYVLPSVNRTAGPTITSLRVKGTTRATGLSCQKISFAVVLFLAFRLFLSSWV